MRLQPGGELFASLRCFSACHGLGIARARLENHPPQPHCFGRITAILGQDGEIAQGEMTVDALADAAELVASLSPLATRTIESVGADPRRLRWRWPRAVGQCCRSMAIEPRLKSTT